jgi:two-component system OmpR family response regulator
VKILVVEDNERMCRFLVRALSEEGYVVDAVSDGATALAQLRTIPYDLVVLDWMLPEFDGLSVVRALRAGNLKVPVLMLTARSGVPERIAGLDAGADDYLTKPFDLSELLARVRALRRRADGVERVLRVKPLVLDLVQRTAAVDGRLLDLTPREFVVLVHLASAAGRAVSRSEILSKVWNMAFDPGSNVVDVHVRKLREKLGPSADIIETVRGVGYRLTGVP